MASLSATSDDDAQDVPNLEPFQARRVSSGQRGTVRGEMIIGPKPDGYVLRPDLKDDGAMVLQSDVGKAMNY